MTRHNAHRITSKDYIPSNDDVLRAPVPVLTDTYIPLGQLSLRLCHVSQRSQRKKWIHYFESVTSIIFCASLADYNRCRYEQIQIPLLTESLVLFESVINLRWFLRTSIILFLTRINEFKVKLPRFPLENYFPEYTGGADVNKGAKYILWRFVQANRARLNVYPQVL